VTRHETCRADSIGPAPSRSGCPGSEGKYSEQRFAERVPTRRCGRLGGKPVDAMRFCETSGGLGQPADISAIHAAVDLRQIVSREFILRLPTALVVLRWAFSKTCPASGKLLHDAVIAESRVGSRAGSMAAGKQRIRVLLRKLLNDLHGSSRYRRLAVNRSRWELRVVRTKGCRRPMRCSRRGVRTMT